MCPCQRVPVCACIMYGSPSHPFMKWTTQCSAWAAVGPRSEHIVTCLSVTPPGYCRSIHLARKAPSSSSERGKGSAPGQSCSDGGQPARNQWGRGRRGGERASSTFLGSILPRVDSIARPTEVFVKYDHLATLPPDVNKLPRSHKAGHDRACEWRLIFAADLQTCTLRRCTALLILCLLTDRLADHCK